jgi:hypothetical protein
METVNNLKEVFGVFLDKESFFNQVDKKKSGQIIYRQLLIICFMGFLYGMAMGAYNNALQAVVSGLKVMVLIVATMLICFPSFFIIQQVLGSRLSLRQMVIILLSGFVLASTITLSFSPIVLFFLVTGNNYHFLQLLHVAVFIFSGVFGVRLIIDALKFACEKKNVYPQIGVTVFRVWIVIFAFVGIQLAWNLRPFLGDKNEGFKLFRKYEGNFYTAIVYSFDKLIAPGPDVPMKKEYTPFSPDSTYSLTLDTSTAVSEE